MTEEIRQYIARDPEQTPLGQRPGLVAQVHEWRQRRNALILVHNYQLPEIQAVADFLGDSLELSRKAAEAEADVIVFCGVHFMAQTAKLLNPDRPVLMPDLTAGCPMADMITPEGLSRFKALHPACPVVAYVNTTAEVKAESDICCTSANSVKIVDSLDEDKVIFVPDKYLAHWTQRQTDKRIIPYQGFCPTHALFTAEMIDQARRERPGAVVMCHPECPPPVIDRADIVASTSGMVRAVVSSDADEFVVATEWGLACRLAEEHPGKRFYIFPDAVCPNMKKTRLRKLVACLKNMTGAVEIAPDVMERARRSVERMLSVT